MLEITPEVKIPLAELEFSYVRSAGPGGQNVNKVASKAVMRWNMEASGSLTVAQKSRLQALYPSQITKEGVLILTSQLTRDAPRNRDDCLDKLKKMVTRSLRVPKRRIPTKPTKGSIQRRLDNKSRKSQKLRQRRISPE